MRRPVLVAHHTRSGLAALNVVTAALQADPHTDGVEVRFARGREELVDALRSVALRKMEGYSNHEIAVQLGCAPRTVARKLRRIRTLWSQEVPG